MLRQIALFALGVLCGARLRPRNALLATTAAAVGVVLLGESVEMGAYAVNGALMMLFVA